MSILSRTYCMTGGIYFTSPGILSVIACIGSDHIPEIPLLLSHCSPLCDISLSSVCVWSKASSFKHVML